MYNFYLLMILTPAQTSCQDGPTVWCTCSLIICSSLFVNTQFNLVLNDNRDVISELRHSVDPPYPQDGCPVKVQITMETPEVEM